MLHNRYPIFTKGRILRLDMLEELRDYPRGMMDILHADLSSGIVAGADIRVVESMLRVTPGIVKFGGRLYMLKEEFSLPYHASGTLSILRLRFGPELRDQDFADHPVEVVLDGSMLQTECELELARFKLKPGARLRDDYESFADYATEYNTLNRIHTPYASPGPSTFYPGALRYYADAVLQAGGGQPQDFAFAMQVLGSERPIGKVAIQHYIGLRLGTGYREYDLAQIHKYLNRILNDIQSGRRGARDYRPGGPQRMLVD
ncbi:DNA and RNA helicase [Paenibacillus sp. FSL W8-0919]|uniref:DNA and RNA helicase n=1 Tax=Paenibacillus sp. FSL W8-0919 TaxID=2954707 RepID=UPI0030F71B43